MRLAILNAYLMRADRLRTSQEVPFKDNRCDAPQLFFKGFLTKPTCFCHHGCERASEIKGNPQRAISLVRCRCRKSGPVHTLFTLGIRSQRMQYVIGNNSVEPVNYLTEKPRESNGPFSRQKVLL